MHTPFAERPIPFPEAEPMRSSSSAAAKQDDPHQTGRDHAGRPMLAGVQVREEDLEPQKGLHFVSVLFRALAVLLLLLMLVQLAFGLGNQAPGSIGLLIGDSVRLLVFAGLLWGAGDLAGLLIKTHYDVRAGRILLARQTYMMKQMAQAAGQVPVSDGDGLRRSDDPH